LDFASSDSDLIGQASGQAAGNLRAPRWFYSETKIENLCPGGKNGLK